MADIDTIRTFIDCINAHDVDGVGELMSDDHRFIDGMEMKLSAEKR